MPTYTAYRNIKNITAHQRLQPRIGFQIDILWLCKGFRPLSSPALHRSPDRYSLAVQRFPALILSDFASVSRSRLSLALQWFPDPLFSRRSGFRIEFFSGSALFYRLRKHKAISDVYINSKSSTTSLHQFPDRVSLWPCGYFQPISSPASTQFLCVFSKGKEYILCSHIQRTEMSRTLSPIGASGFASVSGLGFLSGFALVSGICPPRPYIGSRAQSFRTQVSAVQSVKWNRDSKQAYEHNTAKVHSKQ
jgi:hypothetical protein